MKIKIVIFFLTLFIHQRAFSQKEAYNWYFGQGAGITFNYGKPTVLNKSNIGTPEGCATLSNGKGQFLLYTYGEALYDSNFTITPNGNKLNGAATATQTSIFIPCKDSIDKYFLITNSGTVFNINGGIYYSVVDMKLNSGKGDIIPSKKNILISDSTLEKFCVTKHANRKDYWLIIPKANNDTICSYLVTSAGVSKTPVKSKTGFFVWYYSRTGQMKISPDGKKIAYSFDSNNSIIADFDASTGKATNFWKFNDIAYGLEFSANSSYLYLLASSLVQYNAKAKSESIFKSSRYFISNGWQSSMQMGPDGIIYIGRSDSLYAILRPDSAGAVCKFTKNYISLGKSANLCLPSFLNYFLIKNEVSFTRNCLNDSTIFNVSIRSDYDSLKWDFGDTTSGGNNYSKAQKNIYHIYKKAGSYKTRLIICYRYSNDTILTTIEIKNVKPFIGHDTTICNIFSADIYPKRNYIKYYWNTGNQTKFLSVSKPGTYILNALDTLLCQVSDTIIIKNPRVTPDFSLSDSDQCYRNNSFSFKENTTYIDDSRKESVWYFNDGSNVKDSIAKRTFPQSGAFTVKMVSESNLGCKDSVSKTVKIYPQTKPDFSINKATQCLNENNFDFINTTKDTIKSNYQWDLGDQTYNNQRDIIGKFYLKDSSYFVSLINTTINNCHDTIKKTITILANPKANFSWDNICNRNKTNFSYTGTKPILSYKWLFENSDSSLIENPSILFSTIGTKKVKLTIKSTSGCIDTLTKEITIISQSKADFTTSDVCETDSAIFINKSADATGYRWRFGDGQTSNLNAPKHKYTITSTTTFNVSLVALAAGCSDSINKAITINQNPSSDFTYTHNGSKVDLKITKGGNSYLWKFGTTDSFKTTATSHSHTITSSNQYMVCLTATDISGCSSTSCKNITIGILSHDKPYFKIYPNPNKGSFTIEIENPLSDLSIDVYDLIGNLIKTIETNSSKSMFKIDLNLADGMYWLRVKNGESVWNQKVMVH